MALATGSIVVACPGIEQLRGVFAVDPTSGQQRTLAQGGMLVEPWNVVVLANGRLLVADASAFGTGGLIAIDPDNGQQTKVASSPVFHRPFGLAVRRDGHVVVAYTLRPGSFGIVARVNPANGEHFGVAPTFQFVQPFAVAVDAADNVIVTDPGLFLGESRLIRIDAGVGASIRFDGGGAFTAVAVERTGNLVVTSDEPTNQKLLRFTADGPPTVVSENLAGLPGGLAVEASGAILVSTIRGVTRVNPANGAQALVASMRGAMGLAVCR